ncbi:amidohydrolase family protein [Pontibacter liquoris]|uniref:amidohydrolase family protein n=1 Tax=Pontibacter liquoris TaxID=2905677 RepID=UPI001FA73A12|nr:amidohydrolase family protein [Pontibacter liquoris]
MFKSLPAVLAALAFCGGLSAGKAQNFTPKVNEFIKVKANVIALTDATVLDGSGAPARQHQTVILRNGRIEQVGNAKKIKLPKEAEVINCTGKTLIPGLVMLHEHLYYTKPLDNYFNIAQMPGTFPKLYLAGGATTIRTAGSIEPQTDLALKRMIQEGKLIGPDMDVTAPYIEEAALDIPALNTIQGPEDAARSVNFWADKGCTSFKMYMHATKADLAAVVREAHQRHMKVTGHLCAITYREAADLGIDNLEHGFLASTDFAENKKEDDCPANARKSLQNLAVNSPEMKELQQLLISKGVAVTSTLPVFEPYTNREAVLGGGEAALVPEVRKKIVANWQAAQHKDSASAALFQKELAWEKQFYDAGGLLVAGTDPTGAGRTIAGYANHRQVELLVEGGFTPAEAIKICSLNGAIYLGREKEIGTIEKGKKADLVLINGDLSKDIKQIRQTEIVFKNGVGFDAPKIFESVQGIVGLN